MKDSFYISQRDLIEKFARSEEEDLEETVTIEGTKQIEEEKENC
jgi:hypothetical protein